MKIHYTFRNCLTVLLILCVAVTFANGKKTYDLFNGSDLSNWRITNFGTQGPVKAENGQLILGMGDGATGVTWEGEFDIPRMNYEVTLQAKRVTGNDFFCGLTFPVNDDYLTLVIGGWAGTVVGLSSIDGLDASENETSTMKVFERNRWYDIRLRVHNNIINVWINDIQLIDIDITGRELSLRPEVLLSRPFGFTSWYTKAALKNIKLTVLP